MTHALVDRAQIAAVEPRIRPYLRRTPVLEASGADLGLDAFALTLKLELCQHAGSFKTRGAFANLLTREIPPAGVIAASGGNHGSAVAYAARRLGMGVVSVPIESRYAGAGAVEKFRKSHFRPLHDLWRITSHVVVQVWNYGHVVREYRRTRANRPVIDDPTGEFGTGGPR